MLTDYVYDSDNRVTAVTQGKVKSEYTYNEFNSIKKIKSKKINSNNTESTKRE